MLVKVELHQFYCYLLQLTDICTLFDSSAETLEREAAVHFHCPSNNYYIMTIVLQNRPPGGKPRHSMEITTITYYQVSEGEGFLALVRYTAYSDDGLPMAICEEFYDDTPDEFCRLEEEVENALGNGIDTSIMSCYESSYFPVISAFLSL